MTEAGMRRLRVAIDGPAGAGKSTVARGLAERLGYVLVDTGAIYRTVALAVMREGLAWENTAAIGRLAERLVAERAIGLERAASQREPLTQAIGPAPLGQGAGPEVVDDGVGDRVGQDPTEPVAEARKVSRRRPSAPRSGPRRPDRRTRPAGP